MHLKNAFEIMELEDGFVAVPVDGDTDEFKGVINLNETGAFILNLLSEEITEEEIVDRMKMEYDAPADVLAADVKRSIELFREKGMLG